MRKNTHAMPSDWKAFDAAKYLKTEKDVRDFLKIAFEEGCDDTAYVAEVIGVAARARGMTEVAKQAGITRASLYKALSKKGNPEFATISKVLSVFGLKLKIA